MRQSSADRGGTRSRHTSTNGTTELVSDAARSTVRSSDPVEATVVIGEIVGPFGHRGEVKVYPHTDLTDRLLSLTEVGLVRPDGQTTRHRVRQARRHKSIVVMALAGVETMNHAEDLRGTLLTAPRVERTSLPSGTYYIDDLVGLRVVTDLGRDLGTVRRVITGPANDVYDLGELLIPAIRDVVVRIDLNSREIVIHPIPGLLDDPEVV